MTFYDMHPASDLDLILNVSLKLLINLEIKKFTNRSTNHYKSMLSTSAPRKWASPGAKFNYAPHPPKNKMSGR